PHIKRITLVNAALLVMSSALAVGGDVVPAGWGEPSPSAVIQAGGCCGKAAPAPSCCDPCGSGRAKLLDRLKAKFGAKSSCCAPACPAPPPCPAACPAPACCEKKPNLLDKIKSR